MVPMTVPGCVGRAFVMDSRPSPGSIRVSASLASPKSRILTRPSVVTKMFSGLRSRWRIPRSWASESPWPICVAYSRAFDSVSRPARMTSRRVSPSRSSVTANAVSPSLPKSWISRMLGWERAATALASRLKRSRRSGSAAKSSGSTLIATSRPRTVSCARQTSPMPPAPSMSSTR